MRFGATNVVQQYRENFVMPPWQNFSVFITF